MSQTPTIDHPAFGPAPAASPLERNQLTDRQRLAVLLQGGALVGHLQHAGCHVEGAWKAARVSSEGLLYLPSPRPGARRRFAQELLRELLLRLFRSREGVAGRGEARRAARSLLAGWSQSLTPIAPDQALGQILEAAPFLWQEPFATARRYLAAEHHAEGSRHLWVVGPRAWRLRFLTSSRDLEGARRLLARPRAQELWEEPVAPTRARARSLGTQRLERADALLGRGRFAAALDEVKGLPGPQASSRRLWCLYLLGRYGAARRLLNQLSEQQLPAAELVLIAEVAVRVLSASGELEKARRWVDRALKKSRGRERLAAELVAAGAAWDREDIEAMERHLAAAGPAREDPTLAWRWHHVTGLRWLEERPELAAREISHAIRTQRHRLRRFQVASLWNDLGVARGGAGELAGAERAFLHGQRLLAGCDGPRQTVLTLHNLAEIRLRRGRTHGVREILERSSAENRLSGNDRAQAYDLGLWARYELLLGRCEAALELARSGLEILRRSGVERYRPELAVLAARALGWMGRREEAARALAEAGSQGLSALEAEERPAVLALAGDDERAAALARGTVCEGLWRSVLAGEAPSEVVWEGVSSTGLEPYRLARLVLDVDELLPRAVPGPWLRQAAAVFRRVGAAAFADRLEARDGGSWSALGSYLGQPPGDAEALGELFDRAVGDGVRLLWTSQSEQMVLVDGAGGSQELAAPAAGGELVLRASEIDEVARALFRLAVRDLVLPASAAPRASAGMVGESPGLVRAQERLARLAPTELPVLIRGESGSGKELAARHLHASSPRRQAPFVAVNCAALSETLLLSDLFGHVRGSFTGADRDRAGVFETAQGGTVFLDEIGDLPGNAQGLLLRVLQEKEVRRVGESLPRRVDVRLVTATHRDLEAMSREGSFRQDLFFRLRGAVVELPPLHDRGRDVLLLAEHLLAASPGDPRPRLSAEARSRLLAYAWPGNVRELQNVLGAAAALAPGGLIEPEHLELPEIAGAAGVSEYHQQVDALRRRLIEQALAAARGSQAEAARSLGLTRQALSYLVRQLGLI